MIAVTSFAPKIQSYRDHSNSPASGSVGLVSAFVTALILFTAAPAPAAPAATNSSVAARSSVSPRVRFVATDAALVEWETARPQPSVVEFGESPKLGKRVSDTSATTTHALRLTALKPDTKYFFTITQTAENAGPVSTSAPAPAPTLAPAPAPELFEFDTTFNFFVAPLAPSATNALPADESIARLADTILKTSGVTKGYCLDFACGDGRLALELARRSDLSVIGVSDDDAVIECGRRILDAAGVYGPRVTLLRAPLDFLPFASGCFNLVVSSDAFAGKRATAVPAEVTRVVRPGGGVTLFAPAAPVVSAARPGAGAWTHAYGDAAQTVNSGDATVLGRDMRVQWFGQPGARGMLDRQSRNPPPLLTNGRLFVQGNERLYAQDAANGCLLWTLEIPGLRRVNLPRDSSNMCADDASLFVAVRDRVWQLAAQTGALTRTFLAPENRDWGYVASDGPRLIGTAVKPGSTYTRFQGSWEYWYDTLTTKSTAKVCGDRVFARNKADGKELWSYANGAILNATIVIGGGRICFVESRSPGLADEATSRLASTRLHERAFLVALDAATGRKLWEQPLAPPAKDAITMFLVLAGEQLVLSVSADKKYFVSAFSARDGAAQWAQSHGWNRDNHGGHMYHPVIVGGKVIVEPIAYDLATGKPVVIGLPVRGGCSTMSAAANCVHYINWDYDKGSIYFWDLDTGERRQMAGSRASCWLSLVSGGGMAILPASSSGCTCRYPNQTSIGFSSAK